MQQVYSMRSAKGNDFEVPESDMEEFGGAVPDAGRVRHYRSSKGNSFDVPDTDMEEFKKAVPDAQETRRISYLGADGKKAYEDVTADEFPDFMVRYGKDDKYKADRDAENAYWNRVMSGIKMAQGDKSVADDGRRAVEGLEQGALDYKRDKAAAELRPKSGVEKTAAVLQDLVGGVARTGESLVSGFAKSLAAASSNKYLRQGLISASEQGDYGDKADPMNGESADPHKSAPGKAADWLDDFTNNLFPEESQSGSVTANVIGSAAEEVAGLAKFALTKTPILAFSSFGEAYMRQYDMERESGKTPEHAAQAATLRGAVDTAATVAFKKAPVKRILKAYMPGMEIGGAAGKAVNGALGKMDFRAASKAIGDGIGKAYLAEMVKTAAEMGVLGGVQGFIDSAMEQEATNKDGHIDWGKAAKDGGVAAWDGVKMAAVLESLPTVPRILAAKRNIAKNTTHLLKTENGRELYGMMNPDGVDEVRNAYINTGTVSRKVAADAALPEMMKKAEREQFARDLLADRKAARKAEVEGPELDEVQGTALGEDITKFVGEDSDTFKAVWNNVMGRITDAKELDDPYRREELVRDGIENVIGKPRIQKPKPRMRHEAEGAEERAREEHKQKSLEGMKERARRKAEMEEYEREEAERRQREEEEQNAPRITVGNEPESSVRPLSEPPTPEQRLEQFPEYASWINKNGRKNNDKNWTKFVREHDLDPSLIPPKDEKQNVGRQEATQEAARARAETETGKEKGVATEGAEVPSRADGEVVEKAGEESAQKKYTPEEAAALKKKGKAVPEDKILKPEEVEANKETREEKPDETGNGAAEEPAKPEQGVERPEGKPEAPRPLAGAEKGGKAPDEGALEPKTPENKPQTADINKKSVYSGEEAAKTEPKAEEVRDSMRGDPILQRIDAEFKKAKTDEERNALKEQFAARVAELRKKGKKVPKGAEPTAEEAAEVKAAEAPADTVAAEPVKNAPVSAPSADGATTPQKAAKPAEAKKTGDTAKPAEAPKKAKPVKADAKKAAKVVEQFVAKDATRKTLMNVHHDHEHGVAVATDGRVLIATKHGYDTNAKDDPDNPYPNWRQVVPNYDGATYKHIERDFDAKSGKSVLKETELPVQKVDVDPVAVSATCKKVVALANKINNKGTIFAALKLPDGNVVMMDAFYLRKVADAMAANGITEIKAVDGKKPILAKNEDTTIVAMPMRVEGTDPTEADFRKGRDGNNIVIDALTGRILSAPERDRMSNKSAADAERAIIAEREPLDKTLADKATTDKHRKKLAQIEKRIAAEDEIDALMDGAEQKAGASKKGGILMQKALGSPEAEAESPLKPEAKPKDDAAESQKIKTLTPEQEIEERLDLKRLDPKRRSDQKVLEWAKKTGRRIENGMVLPDAVREYDEHVTRETAKLAKRWFPDMNIVQHKFGEHIKRGQHVLDRLVDDEGIIKAFENEDGTVTVYRAVQVNEKGEVRPPQSTRVQESDGKIIDRPAEGYVDKDGNIRSASGGAVVIKAEERPDLAHRVKNRDGTWKKVTERDVKDGRYPPEMLGADKWFFDLKKAKGTGSTDNVVYDPYMHSSDTPLNDQFTSAWKRPDWRIAVSRVLKSDLESGYRADKAGLSVGAHEWKGGAVDNQLPKNMKRKVFLTQHLKMERILPEAEAARILKEKWGEMGLKLEIPDSRVSPAMREALIKEGFNVVKTGDVQYLRDRAGNTLGWFDPRSKEVHLLPGADAETVGHEILWHGTRDYATKRAAQGDTRAQKLLDMMHDVENNVPPAMRTQILHAYRKTPGLTRDMLLNEFGAWFTQKKFGAALEEALKTKEGQNWFAKAFTTVKEMYKDYLTAHGKNRIDLDKIDGMSRDQFIDFMAEQFAGGKTLGNIKGDNLLSTEETKWQARRRKYYDNNAPVRDLERDVEKKTGRKISADDSVEAANALKHGLKEAANIEIQGKLKNFKQALHEAGLHIEDFEYYAQLRAAAGRDAKIDKRNLAEIERKMKAKGASQDEIDAAKAAYRSTNGSHVSPEEARKLLAEINASPDKAKFEALWDEMQSIIKETLDTQVEAGLVSKEAAEAWRKEEPEYIPFKNEYDAESGDWSGRGSALDFTRPEVYTAKGRQSAAGDIVAHVFMDHQAAKHRAIENAVRQKLAKLVRDNPEIGKVEAVDADAWKGLEKDDPNVVTFKEGGQSYVIRLNGTRGAAIANAFTQRNLLKMGWADKGFSVFGKKISFRTFSQVSSGLATRYSPTFFVRNFTKDNIELANIIYSERGPIEGTKWIASYVKSQATMAKTLAKYVATGKMDATPEGDILKRYIKAGGLIAGGVQAEGMASLKEQLTPESILKEAKHGKSKVYAAGKFVLDSIGKLNEFGELATRLNAFATEVRSGKSDAEAALFSRRATVDFNRHGDYTPAFNMIRLFSNSSLGATARAAVALGKSKYGKAAAASLFTLGLSQALIEHFANQDEDERRKKTGEATGKDVSEFERETALFYFRKGDRVYKVAQHSSPFSLINYAGNCVGRWLCGDLKGEDMAKNLGLTAAEMAYMFLPMGSINARSRKGDLVSDAKAAIVSGVVPSSLQPLFEMAFDMDYKGDAVFRHMMNSQDPKSHNGKNSTPDWVKDAAEWMNDATGGNAGKPGKIDLAPEAIQKLVEGFGKNLGKDISMAVNIGEALIKGEFGKIGPRETPVKRDFVKQIDGNDRRFNDSLSTYNSDMNEWRKMRDEWTKEQRAEYKKAHPWVISDRAKELKKKINELHKRENGMTNRSGKWKKAETPPTDEQIEQWRTRRRKLQAEFLTKLGGE